MQTDILIDKFQEAQGIFRKNIGLIAPLILTVWLPGNFLSNLFFYQNPEMNFANAIQLPLLIDAIFSPLCMGALVYALYRIKQGETVTYNEAITVGLKNWFTLFTAKLMAGLFVLVGLIAFFVPGIVLLVRYSFIDATVVIEGMGAHDSRKRSMTLTTGIGWQIFAAGFIFHVCYFLMIGVVYSPFGSMESNAAMFIETGLDCVMDVLYVVIQIVIFLFYWDAVKAADKSDPEPAPDSPPTPEAEP